MLMADLLMASFSVSFKLNDESPVNSEFLLQPESNKIIKRVESIDTVFMAICFIHQQMDCHSV